MVEIPQKMIEAARPAEEIVFDQLRSYGAALRELDIRDQQRSDRWANNRIENSHQPFRRRERPMLRFRRTRTLQKFASVHAAVFNHFNQERSLSSCTLFEFKRKVKAHADAAAVLSDECAETPRSPSGAASAPNK